MKTRVVSCVAVLCCLLVWGAGAVDRTGPAFADAAAQSWVGNAKTGHHGQGGEDPGATVAEPSSWSLFFYLAILSPIQSNAIGMKAGTAKTVITPDKAEKINDLCVRVLTLHDGAARLVIVTYDLHSLEMATRGDYSPFQYRL